MFFQKPVYQIFLMGLVALALTACDPKSNNGETTAVQMESLSLEDLTAKAENGVPAAQYYLGLRYENGEGVAKDFAEAKRLIGLAADQGYADAQYDMGVFSYYDSDFTGAIRWWRLAAGQGHAWAQFNLGGMYGFGQGVPQDDAEAAKWYQLSAEQGHPGAQANLGFQYRDGRGVPRDLVAAYMWLGLAGADGDELATRNKNSLKEKMTPEQVAEAERLTEEWLVDHQ